MKSQWIRNVCFNCKKIKEDESLSKKYRVSSEAVNKRYPKCVGAYKSVHFSFGNYCQGNGNKLYLK